MKRNITILAITTAVVMMWVHALVPHHHHNGEVCFVETHDVGYNHSANSSNENNSEHHKHTSCNLLNDLAQAEKFRFPASALIVKTTHIVHSILAESFWANLHLRIWTSKYIFYFNFHKRWQSPLLNSISFRAPPF
ncbi:DUF6769 family protein [Tenuifilum thalassicum]|uniref:Uncharacterized protein n=1 Tax=Tenuifilum thalassicum TaxID=2590900 RepID=A0A7D4CH65_9BACT|nr:DUF6769 family protein [Tenuifilum thalassicum]QKG80306.1 hypothetical protein FHG85_08545 [Tenuifilum thalassicum]